MLNSFFLLLLCWCCAQKTGNVLTEKAKEYFSLLVERPLRMGAIKKMETPTLQAHLTEKLILSSFAPFRTFDQILYSKISNNGVPSHQIVELGIRWRYTTLCRKKKFTFFFNTISLLTFTDEEPPVVSNLRTNYNWTCPPYAETDNFSEIQVPVGPLQLPGILSIPNPKMFPRPTGVVNLIAGSGPGDADETSLGMKPFKDIAWGLASKGVAVLRYPKRYHLHKPANINFTYEEEYMIDCEAAVDLLYEKFNIPVISVSHSEGGKVVPLLSQRKRKKMKGFISLAGSVEHMVTGFIRQVYYILKVTNTTITPELKEILDELEKVEEMLENHTLPLDYPLPYPYAGSLSANYLIAIFNLDNVKIANELIDFPFLEANGDKDYQVTIKDSFDVWKQRNTNEKGSFEVLECVDHFLNIVEGTPSPVQNSTPQNVALKIINMMFDFIQNLSE